MDTMADASTSAEQLHSPAAAMALMAGDPDKDRIDKADLANISTSYAAAYGRAISSVKNEIKVMQSQLKNDNPKFTKPYADFISANIEHINLETRNAGTIDTPAVQVVYTFLNAGAEEVKIVINYDNPAHDLRGDNMKNVVRLRRMEVDGKDGKINKDKKHAAENKRVTGMKRDLYTHFGWTVSRGKVKRTGHAYLTFKVMEMGRSTRPEPGATGMIVAPAVVVPPTKPLTGSYVVTSFTKARRDADNVIIASKHQKAEAALTASLQ